MEIPGRHVATLLMAVCLSLAGGAASALDRDIYELSLENLGDITVTDTKIAQPRESATQKIEILTPNEISRQTTDTRNLSELLQYTSGQFINVLSRNDSNWGSYAGLGPEYNTWLLDGLPIDSFVDPMSIAPWAIEQIEIHKGPAAVMYANYLSMDFAGNEAPLAGTTNLVLKERIDAPLTRILLGGGSWDTVNGRFYHQNRSGAMHYFFGVNHEESDYTNYGTADSWLNMLKSPEYSKTRLYGKMTWLLGRNDHSLSIFAHHTDHSGDTGRLNRDFRHRYDTINAAYANQVSEAVNLQVKTGYRGYDRRWAEDNFPADLGLREHDGVEQSIFPSDVTVNILHAGASVLTVGADSQVALYKTYAEAEGVKRTQNDVTAYATGAFLQEKLVIDRLVLRGGVRYNYTQHSYDLLNEWVPERTTNSWDKFLWSLGFRHNTLPSVAFYGNAGSSFVVPSAKQIGGSIQASRAGVAGFNGQLPNLGLKQESGIGSDLGCDLKPLDSLTIGLRGFFNRVDDAIVETPVSSTPSQSRSVNVGKATSYGIEADVRHVASDTVQWFANATFTATDVQNPLDPDQDGAELPFAPDWLWNAGFSATLPYGITISPFLHGVGTYFDSTSRSGRKKLGSFQVVNVKVQKTLLRTGSYVLHAALDLNNITDKRYEMPWQYRNPGFNAFGNLELNF